MIDLATTLTDELLEEGMTIQILKLISTIQVEKEMEKLSNQRGLGDKKHRKLVSVKFFKYVSCEMNMKTNMPVQIDSM